MKNNNFNDYLKQNDVIKVQNKLLKTLYDIAILQIDTDITNNIANNSANKAKDDILSDIVVLKGFIQLTASKAAAKKTIINSTNTIKQTSIGTLRAIIS